MATTFLIFVTKLFLFRFKQLTFIETVLFVIFQFIFRLYYSAIILIVFVLHSPCKSTFLISVSHFLPFNKFLNKQLLTNVRDLIQIVVFDINLVSDHQINTSLGITFIVLSPDLTLECLADGSSNCQNGSV